MGTYTYKSYAYYSDGSQSVPILGNVDDRELLASSFANDTANDGEADTTFELSPTADQVSFVFDPDGMGDQTLNLTYSGQITINSIDVPVFTGTGTLVGAPFNYFIVLAHVQPIGGFSYPTSLPMETATTFAICFAADTRIATPQGEHAVQDLKIGDIVFTARGHEVPVRWLGHQTLHKWHHGPQMQPVRIRADALGDGLPHSDLTVTADHGMVIDGYVINASALVNGETIDFVPFAELDDSFTVYHIETEAHDVILANGAPSETFIDAAGRAAFDNHAEYLALYGAERIIPQMTMPRISSVRLVPQSIRTRLRCGTKGLSAAAPLLKRVS